MIKKIIMVLMSLMLVSFSFAYSGSGTSANPYLVSTCNDFHLLNIDEDYTSKVYISILENLDCSSFSDNRLINKTINGLFLEGNGKEIFNYTNNKLMADINIGIDSKFQNINFNDSKFFGIFTNAYFDTQNGQLSFINYSHYESVSASQSYYSPYFIYNSHIDANNVTFNLEKVKINIDTSIKEGWTPLYNVDGLNDQFNINFNMVYYNISANSGAYDGFLTGQSGNGDEFNNIYVNKVDYILRGYPYRVLLFIGRLNNINDLIINNTIIGTNQSLNSNNHNLNRRSHIQNLKIYNTIVINGNGFNDLFENFGTYISSYKFNNNIQDADLTQDYINWTRYNVSDIYGNNIYSGWDSSVFTFSENTRPFLKWVTEDEEPALNIECENLNYQIYEYSNLTYDISCTTNDFFINYTFLNETNSILATTNLTISGITYNISNDIYPLKVCVDAGSCVDYNVTIINRFEDDINPYCEPLPEITIYEETDFNVFIDCSDRYTNLTLSFYTFPESENINTTLETNSSIYQDNITFSPPENDFTLYLLVNDSRGNNILYNNFYSLNSAITPVNESIKGGVENTTDAIIYLTLIGFFVVLFILGVLFEIPVFLIFSGVGFLFMGVVTIYTLVIAGIVIILTGVVVLGMSLSMITKMG